MTKVQTAAWLPVAAACAVAPAMADDRTAAEDVVVVVGSLSPRPIGEIGSAVSVIDADTLGDEQIVLVSDALRDVPGLAVSRSGPVGALTQVRIRGAEANQTLVFIDGVEANDPVSGEFNFASLLAGNVASVQVVRGPQSALYGSEAIGGVLAVETIDPRDGFDGALTVEGGSFGTRRGFAAAAVGGDRGGVRAAFQTYHTDGISASPTGQEEDGFNVLAGTLKGQWRPTGDSRVEAVIRAVDSRADADAQEFAFGTVTDAAERSEDMFLTAKIDGESAFWDGRATLGGFVAYTESDSTTRVAAFGQSGTRGERVEGGVRASVRYDTGDLGHTVTLAAEHERFDFEGDLNSAEDDQTSVILEYGLSYAERVFLSGAVRHDRNDTFDDATTARFAGSYLVTATDTRLHGSWGQGITDPTFFERFGFDPGSFTGNPDLRPEESTGWDIGMEQRFADGRGALDVTYFKTTLTDEISTSFAFDAVSGTFLSTPVNQDGESRRKGLEASARLEGPHGLRFAGSYTYLDATDADGLVEVRRPRHQASAGVTWQGAGGRTLLHLGADYNGEMEDLFFGFSDPGFTRTRPLDAFTLVRVAGSYAVSDTVEIFARGENILDETYQEVLGFAAPGAAVYAGIRVTTAPR